MERLHGTETVSMGLTSRLFSSPLSSGDFGSGGGALQTPQAMVLYIKERKKAM